VRPLALLLARRQEPAQTEREIEREKLREIESVIEKE
jgi:hypothetical protein